MSTSKHSPRHLAQPSPEAQAMNTQAILSAQIELPNASLGRHTAQPTPEATHAEAQAYYLASLDPEES